MPSSSTDLNFSLTFSICEHPFSAVSSILLHTKKKVYMQFSFIENGALLHPFTVCIYYPFSFLFTKNTGLMIQYRHRKEVGMKEYTCILYSAPHPVAIITLNRPRVLNAMNRTLWADLEHALQRAANDEEVKTLIITGAGRAFSTGADLKESKDRDASDYRGYLVRLQEITRMILRFQKPIIAAINGYALGSGYELALACDIRISADDAQIGSPEARVSSSVTGGALRLLPQLVGPGMARELLFTAENISGRRAAEIGLVNRSVPLESLMSEAMAMAEKISRNNSFSLLMMKKGLLIASGEASLEALMDFEIEACLACVATKERSKSLQAFENRKKDTTHES
jgi:enoyl-CoA hydratase